METETSTQTRAAVAVVTSDGYGVGYADQGVPGYTPTTYTAESYDDAKVIAQGINDAWGLTPAEASAIVLSTMSLGGR